MAKSRRQRLEDITAKALSGAMLTAAERRQYRKCRGKLGGFEWRLLGCQRKDENGKTVIHMDALTNEIIKGHQKSKDEGRI